MGRDGEWIRDEADEDDWEEDDWPDDELLDDQLLDDEWLDDDPADDEWLDDDPAAGPGWPMGSGGPAGPGWPTGLDGPAGPGYGKHWGHGGVSGFPGWVAVAVAVMAATAGAAVGFFLIRGAPVASATAGAKPSASAPASAPASSGSGADLPVRPGLPGNASGNEQVRMLLTGRVLAVSATSITIGGAGPSVTAAITSATKLTGSAHAIGGVKVGDEVAAEITGTSSHLVTITLQDPAQ